MIDEISKILGFNYSVQIVADGSYGSYNAKTDTWNGMIGELLSQKADLAVADLTITYEREQVNKTQLLTGMGTEIRRILSRKKIDLTLNDETLSYQERLFFAGFA